MATVNIASRDALQAAVAVTEHEVVAASTLVRRRDGRQAGEEGDHRGWKREFGRCWIERHERRKRGRPGHVVVPDVGWRKARRGQRRCARRDLPIGRGVLAGPGLTLCHELPDDALEPLVLLGLRRQQRHSKDQRTWRSTVSSSSAIRSSSTRPFCISSATAQAGRGEPAPVVPETPAAPIGSARAA